MTPPAQTVEKNASSYVDPYGYVFERGGSIYRSISKKNGAFYRRLLLDGTVDALVNGFGLVPTKIADLRIDDPDSDFVVEHERIEPMTFCVEWCPAMLHRAAKLTVELLYELARHGATLQDAYPWNILFRGTRAVFVDFTSIVPAPRNALWPAYSQFQAFFLRPLILARQKKSDTAREGLYNNIMGITQDAFYRHLSLTYKLLHPCAALAVIVDGYVQQRPSLKKRLRAKMLSAFPDVSDATRVSFAARLRRRVDAFRFDDGRDIWSSYYEDMSSSIDRQRKLRTVDELLSRIRPQTVTDLGCNTGCFSVVAAKLGARVLAIDNSETCINRLFAEAARSQLAITPIVSDVLCPTPAFGFLGQQYPSLPERGRSDVVLCLALMHHLHIAGRQSFDRIAKLMDSFAKRHLVFEFVAENDENNDLIGAGREIHYTLDDVISALKRHFPEIHVMDSDRETRRILMCSKAI